MAGAGWKIWKSALLGLVALVLMTEALMRTGLLAPRFTDDKGLAMVLDEERLFRFAPQARPDFNSMGYRDREFPSAKTPARKRVLFLGDSFVMGLHVKPHETMPALLEAESGARLEVFNMGVYSYGPDQSLIALMEDGLRLDPDIVVLALYPSNDYDDLYLNRIFDIGQGGALVKSRQNALTEWMPALRTLYLGRYLMYRYGLADSGMGALFARFFGERNNDDAFVRRTDTFTAPRKEALMRGVLRKFKQELKGVKLVVVILPSYWNIQDHERFQEMGWPADKYFINEEIAARICSSEGIEGIELAPEFFTMKLPQGVTLYDPADHHLSVYGHKVVVGRILERLGR